MIYRDDLFQAHGRIQQLERELHAEREKNRLRDEVFAAHAKGLLRELPQRRTYVPADELRAPLWAWWPVAVVFAGIVGYLIAFGAVPPEPPFASGLPYDWAVISGVAGAAVYAMEIVLRWRSNGKRSMLGRLLIVIAVIVSVPALTLAAFGLGPILGLIAAIGTAAGGLVALVRWILQGTTD